MSVVPVLPVGHQEDELRSLIYGVGFVHAAWSDTVLAVGSFPVLRLHALIISQSPVLYHHLKNQSPQQGKYQITLETKDPAITAEAVSTAIATLYGNPLDVDNYEFDFLQGLLGAGCLFGLDKISHQAYDLMLKHLTPQSLPQMLEFALNPSFMPGDDSTEGGPYPLYTQGLVAYLVDYILEHFEVQQFNGTWTRVFDVLPFAIYKQIVESPKLKVASPMDRHNFASRATKARKRADEQVVLAFGNGQQGVQIVQRKKKLSK